MFDNHDNLEKLKSVFLPNGHSSLVTHISSCVVDSHIRLRNILFEPIFYYNLISVSKLIHDLKCSVMFLHGIVGFQSLSGGKIIGIGREERGLFVFKGNSKATCSADVVAAVISSSVESFLLWHRRLGHASFVKMSCIPLFQTHLPNKFENEICIKNCCICPLQSKHELLLI